jgi:hypothetical protein
VKINISHESNMRTGVVFSGTGDAGTSPVAVRTGYDKENANEVGFFPDSMVRKKKTAAKQVQMRSTVQSVILGFPGNTVWNAEQQDAN